MTKCIDEAETLSILSVENYPLRIAREAGLENFQLLNSLFVKNLVQQGQ